MANFTEILSKNRAGMASPLIRQSDGSGFYCLRFWWGMQGENTGLFGVYIVVEGSTSGEPIFATLGKENLICTNISLQSLLMTKYCFLEFKTKGHHSL